MSDAYTGHLYPWQMWQDEYGDGTPVYMVGCPDLGGCMTHGDTPEAALESLKELVPFYLECLEKWGLPIPPPTQREQQQPQPQAWLVSAGRVKRLSCRWETPHRGENDV